MRKYSNYAPWEQRGDEERVWNQLRPEFERLRVS